MAVDVSRPKSPSRILFLNHTTLPCRDPYAGARFYTAVFNCDVDSEEHHNQVFLGMRICDGVTLDCFGVEGYGQLTLEQTHPHHAFEIAPEDVVWWIERLQWWGVPFEARARRSSGSVALYFRDPDGHHLEITCPQYPDELFDQLPPLDYRQGEHLTPMNSAWPPPERAEEAERQFQVKLEALRARKQRRDAPRK